MKSPVHEDERFLRRVWKVQRASCVCMAFIAALALVGLCGGGPLSCWSYITGEILAVTGGKPFS